MNERSVLRHQGEEAGGSNASWYGKRGTIDLRNKNVATRWARKRSYQQKQEEEVMSPIETRSSVRKRGKGGVTRILKTQKTPRTKKGVKETPWGRKKRGVGELVMS